MRFLYICRQFNRSGYYILQHLLLEGKFIPLAVLLPKPYMPELIDDLDRAESVRQEYEREVAYYGGRSLRFMQSIRLLAESYNVPVIERQEIKSDEAYAWLESLDLDLIVLGGGWKQLIPKQIIDLPRFGILNTHPSLLPDFRGTDVHRWQVWEGTSVSGITIHYLDESFDTGDILGRVEVEVSSSDTPQDIAEKTGIVAGQLMSEILAKIVAGMPIRLQGEPQTNRDDDSRYYSRWRWDDRQFLTIDWTRSALELSRFVLASTQESYKYNGPFFFACGKEYILRQASVERYEGCGESGEVVGIDDSGILVFCQQDSQALLITQVQPATEDGWRTHFHADPAIDARIWAKTIGLKVGDKFSSTLTARTNE